MIKFATNLKPSLMVCVRVDEICEVNEVELCAIFVPHAGKAPFNFVKALLTSSTT